MAASPLNHSKITDYFPPSPSQDDPSSSPSRESGNDAITNINEKDFTTVSSKCKVPLDSSAVLTPQSTPEKTKPEADVEQQSQPDQTAESVDRPANCTDVTVEPSTKHPAAKKTLTEKIEKEADKEHETPRPKSRRRGRRKKQTSTPKTDSTISSTAIASPTVGSKPKTARKKKTEPESSMKNTLVTDYFPVRRSDRKCKTEIQKEKETELQTKILNGCEDGLKVEEIGNKGRGVIATKKFLRGDFVVEYAGDLISIPEAKERDSKYGKDPTKGCYMYYFNHKNKNYCIDATAESGKLGRLLNHSKTLGNCHTKLVDIKNRPFLILVASRDINEGEELLYDYGDRSKESLESHPWLKS